MSDNMGKNRPFDPISEGAEARRKGEAREACPYPVGSADRDDWVQGFDGRETDAAPDLPLDGR